MTLVLAFPEIERTVLNLAMSHYNDAVLHKLKMCIRYIRYIDTIYVGILSYLDFKLFVYNTIINVAESIRNKKKLNVLACVLDRKCPFQGHVTLTYKVTRACYVFSYYGNDFAFPEKL